MTKTLIEKMEDILDNVEGLGRKDMGCHEGMTEFQMYDTCRRFRAKRLAATVLEEMLKKRESADLDGVTYYVNQFAKDHNIDLEQGE